MNEVIIRIIDTVNNVEGDLDLTDFNDFPLAINKGIVNLDNLKERTGTFTKMFKVPNSKNNTNLLSNVDNINSRKDFRDCLNKKPCIILVNNNPVEHGFVQVLKAFNDEKGGYFELVFFGDNIDWVKDATDLKLNTIQWTNNEITLNQGNIDTINQTTSSNTDIAFPYISRGGNTNTDATSVTDYLPCIYTRSIIQKSFKSLGYKVESNFLSEIRQLVCDLSLNYSQIKSNVESSKVRAKMVNPILVSVNENTTKRIIFDDDTTSPNQDQNNHYNTITGIYTVPTTGVYNITVFINGFNPIGDAVGQLRIIKNGLTTTSIGNGETLENRFLVGSGNKDENFNGVQLNANDEISFYINPDDESTTAITYASGTFFNIQLSSEVTEGSTFSVSSLIPDSIKFIDILNDVTRMFNIYYWTDVKTKTVYFEPRDTFFQSQTTAIDWSNKLDTSKGYNVDYVSSYKRNINFSYKQDNKDGYLEEWNILNKKTYGKYTHTLPDRFAKGNSDIALSFFSATYGHKALEVSNDTGFSTLKIWKEFKDSPNTPEERNQGYQPRIFFHRNGTQESLDGTQRIIRVDGNGTTTENRTTMPYGSFEVYYNNEIPSPSFNLNFTDGFKADETTEDIGLFKRFYSKMFKNIEEGGRLVAFFDLSSTDIQNLDFRKLIYLDGDSNVKGYYLVEKVIDFNPLNSDLTKVSLFKFEDLGSVAIDGSQTGNNDVNTDNGLTGPELENIFVELSFVQPILNTNIDLLLPVTSENPITNNIENVVK